jgi:hypothetical protein
MSDHFDPASSTFPINFATTPGFETRVGTCSTSTRSIASPTATTSSPHATWTACSVWIYPSGNVLWTLGHARNENDPHPRDRWHRSSRIVGDPYNGPKRTRTTHA